MWMHYVYIHRRASDGEIFYVGKGTATKRKGHQRAYDLKSRNLYWRRVAKKHGVVVEIIASCESDKEAQTQEIRLIAEIGRLDLGTGPLVNMTDGGEGQAGLIISDELRRKRSINSSGKRSAEWVKSIRAARKNGGNGGVVKFGDKLPESWVANLAAAKVGDKNPYFGKPSPPSKKVRNAKTGAIYDSIARAAAAEGIGLKALYQYLDGTRRNKTPLMRVGDGLLV